MSPPPWLKKWRSRNVEIHRRGDNYYAYRVSSVYDKRLKRSKKKTDEYLGKLTRDGVLPPKHKRQKKVDAILEAGNIQFIRRFTKVLTKPLQEFWPESWQSILVAGVLKMIYREPLKRLQFRYETSLASRIWPDAHLSKNYLTQLLERLGREWGCQRSFFEFLARGETNMAIDLTQVFSHSQNISWLEVGYNHQKVWHEQFQFLLIWAMDSHCPGFLKLLPGSVGSAVTLVRAITESRLRNVTLVGDKGFYSKDNVKVLEDNGTHYMLALRRDLPFLEYVAPSRYSNHILYRKSVQWWREYEWMGRRVVCYIDKVMAGEEELAFLERVDVGKAKMKDYHAHRHQFGTLTLLTDTGLPPKELYEFYKQRREIELAFDSFKNTLEGDKTWMQSRESLQGYLFILFISLHLYSQILDHLRRKDLLKKYSVHDVLWELSKVYQLLIDGKPMSSEIPNSVRKLGEELEVSITQNLGS